jgi:glutathione S-transferase
MSVFVALQEKGLAFEGETVDLASGANHAPDFARLSQTHRVPTLVHDSFALSESTAITEYLDEAFPGRRLYPAEVRARAKARQLQAWLRSDLMPIREERSTEVIFYGARMQALSPSAVAAAQRLFDAIDAILPPDADHLFGDWTIADTDVALMLNRLVVHGDAVPERLAAYARRQWQRPSTRAWVERIRTG